MKIKWPEGANYFAVDEDDTGYFYITKPVRQKNKWKGYFVYKKKSYGIAVEIKVDLDGMDWRTTLIKRPEIQTPKFTEVKKILEEL